MKLRIIKLICLISIDMKEIIKKINKLTGKYRLYEVFKNIIEMFAITISNNCDMANWDRREKRYLEIAKRYNKKEIDIIGEIFALIVIELENEPRDVLGELYMRLELGSDEMGQFFTPYHASELMANLAMTKEHVEDEIKNCGFISLYDSCVGAGSMMVAGAMRIKTLGYNYQKQLFISCGDLDPLACMMCYIHLSLLGIPAEIYQQNALTQETLDVWYTPFYILDLWKYRLSHRRVNQGDRNVEVMKKAFGNK